MEPQPPLPVAQALLLCREIFEDMLSKDHLLIAPLRDIQFQHMPAIFQASVYLEVTSGHGDYRPSLQLRDLEDQVVWSFQCNQPFPMPDPLRSVVVTMNRINLCIPRPGKYDFVVLVNNREIARRPFWVRQTAPPPVQA